MNISIITVTVILLHVLITMQQPAMDSYYSSSFSVFQLAFQVYIPHIISTYVLQPTVII